MDQLDVNYKAKGKKSQEREILGSAQSIGLQGPKRIAVAPAKS